MHRPCPVIIFLPHDCGRDAVLMGIKGLNNSKRLAETIQVFFHATFSKRQHY